MVCYIYREKYFLLQSQIFPRYGHLAASFSTTAKRRKNKRKEMGGSHRLGGVKADRRCGGGDGGGGGSFSDFLSRYLKIALLFPILFVDRYLALHFSSEALWQRYTRLFGPPSLRSPSIFQSSWECELTLFCVVSVVLLRFFDVCLLF